MAKSRLSYVGKFTPELVQTINEDNDCLDISNQVVFPDQDTKIGLYVEWSQAEFTDIISAVVNGSLQATPDTYQNTVATFLRLIFCNMSICDAIANCIETNETTRDAIQQFLSELGIPPTAGDNPPVPISEAQSGENILPSGYTCDNDHLFGMSRYIVQQLHRATLQLLGTIELLTNPAELLVELSDNVEGISWFASGAETVAWFQDQLIEYYETSFTTSVEDDLACAIFCLIKDDCTLSLDKIINAYSQNSFGVPSDTNDLVEVIDWLVNTTLNASIGTVATYHYFIAQALRFGTSVLGIGGFRSLRTLLSLATDETDSDWNTLCTTCPTEGLQPVIISSCAGGGSGGTNIQDLGGGTWSIDSTTGSVDERVVIADINGNPFKLTAVTNLEPTGYYGWQPNGSACTINASPPNYSTVVFDEMTWTRPLGQPFTVQFTMVEP